MKQIKPLTFAVYFWTVAILGFLGLADSLYLSISHYLNYTDIGHQSFCAISKAINCDTVSQSQYSILLNIPVPVWGVVGYIFLILLLLFAWDRHTDTKRMWSIIFLLSSAFSLYSIILALISTYFITSYCIMCIISYAINFLLLYYAWLIRRRFNHESIIQEIGNDIRFLWKRKNKSVPVLGVFFSAVMLIGFFFPRYWHLDPPSLSTEIPQGITEEGHPWIGSENATLVIEEFTDYQCFQCKKMHFFLRRLLESYPGKIKLVHRHYPMDHRFNPMVKQPFHIGSGKMALLANYAATKDRFWEMNDTLFGIADSKDPINIKELSEKLNFDPVEMARALNDRNLRRKLLLDIKDGIKLGITGTPGYVIEGKLYLGQIPKEIVGKLFN